MITWACTNIIVYLIIGDAALEVNIWEDITDEDALNEIEKKIKNFQILQYIIIACILTFATINYIKNTRTTYYTVEVEITTNEIDTHDLQEIKGLDTLPFNLRKDKIQDVNNTFF